MLVAKCGHRVAPDRVERPFQATASDPLWVADITYVEPGFQRLCAEPHEDSACASVIALCRIMSR